MGHFVEAVLFIHLSCHLVKTSGPKYRTLKCWYITDPAVRTSRLFVSAFCAL